MENRIFSNHPGSTLSKLLTLQAELVIKAKDPERGMYEIDQYQLYVHVIDVIIKNSTSERELESQYINTKNNLSTLKMVLNASKLIFAEEVELGGLSVPNEKGQISFAW
ncbi:hypothetical protein EHS13_20025 [Paenibacillus psychroresistens]|uniref:Uncharacterized protein n=1 Tax=Paenibacillus psychroresistens TaxID=1778678 RepID=A0A6B8RNW8_9BACL|nr:hypothetical protein [Paenibacillus psychroresistens]QGQ97008.1 hypothetical protein EHS13_20025 [Paenibacillus psychroresistens]